MKIINRNYAITLLFVSALFFINSGNFTGGKLLAQEENKPKRLAPFVPTPMDVVEKMLELAGVKPGDVVYDLGCGDGRIVVMAAEKYGVRGVGVDYNPERVAEARERIRMSGVEKLVRIIQGDALKVDLSEATVVTLYLTTDGNEAVRPNLEKYLKPGSRVVSHDFSMPGWKPKKVESIRTESEFEFPFYDEFEDHRLYLWVIGEHKEEKQ